MTENIAQEICKSFQKIAKELFDPKKIPPVPSVVIQKENIDLEKNDVRQGASPSEHRLNLTKSRTGILSKNRQSNKANASYN